MNCYGMGWDETEKYVPWTACKIIYKILLFTQTLCLGFQSFFQTSAIDTALIKNQNYSFTIIKFIIQF